MREGRDWTGKPGTVRRECMFTYDEFDIVKVKSLHLQNIREKAALTTWTETNLVKNVM